MAAQECEERIMQIRRLVFMMIPIVGTVGITSLCVADTVPAQSTGAAVQIRPPAIGTEEARTYAREVNIAAKTIADKYVQPVEQKKLAAHGILSLYAATQTPLPENLRGDPEKIFDGRDLDEELFHARVALGNPAIISFQHRRDVRLSIQAMLSTLD